MTERDAASAYALGYTSEEHERLMRQAALLTPVTDNVAGPLTVIIWSCEALRLFFVLTALGLDLPLSGVVFVAVATSLLTTVPLTPAGFGFVEIAMVYVLTEGFGLAQSDAVAVAVVDRAVSVLSLIIVGAIVYVRTPHEERVGRG